TAVFFASDWNRRDLAVDQASTKDRSSPHCRNSNRGTASAELDFPRPPEDEIMGDRLKEKVELVSGAGSSGPGWGNGKATEVLFAHEGAKGRRSRCQSRCGARNQANHRGGRRHLRGGYCRCVPRG